MNENNGYQPIPQNYETEFVPADVPYQSAPRTRGGKIKYPRFHIFQFLFIFGAMTFVAFVSSFVFGVTAYRTDQITGRQLEVFTPAAWPGIMWVIGSIALIVLFVVRYVKAQRDYKAMTR